MFLPALAALAAGVAGSGIVWLPAHFARSGWKQRVLAAPLVALLGYLVFGSALRWLFADQIHANYFKVTVRLAAGLAVALTAGFCAFWPQVTAWFANQRVSLAAAVVLATVLITWNLGQYTVGGLAASSTIAHRWRLALPCRRIRFSRASSPTAWRLRTAFGLSLSAGFNYDDRFERNDARYILTYGLSSVGFESQSGSGLIQEILDRYPNRRIIEKFEIDETPGPDQAWLIEKSPPPMSAAASGSNRAPD